MTDARAPAVTITMEEWRTYMSPLLAFRTAGYPPVRLVPRERDPRVLTLDQHMRALRGEHP